MGIIVLHEIYGVNQFILDISKEYHSWGYDVYCPNFLKKDVVYSYDQKEEAYESFINNVGFGIQQQLSLQVGRLAGEYEQLFLIGFSVGATLAWRIAGNIRCAGIVCHYGTQIRNYCDSLPLCPTLLIMADQDSAYPPERVQRDFNGMSHTNLKIVDGRHGFCDPYVKEYHLASASKAKQFVHDFIGCVSESGKVFDSLVK